MFFISLLCQNPHHGDEPEHAEIGQAGLLPKQEGLLSHEVRKRCHHFPEKKQDVARIQKHS